MEMFDLASAYGPKNHGLTNLGNVHWNLSPPALYEYAVQAQKLARLFCENFEQFKQGASPEIVAAGSRAGVTAGV